MPVTFLPKTVQFKTYVSNEIAPIPNSKDPVFQAANAVCIKE